jgi:hypothetical protein
MLNPENECALVFVSLSTGRLQSFPSTKPIWGGEGRSKRTLVRFMPGYFRLRVSTVKTPDGGRKGDKVISEKGNKC